jgi:phosphatidylglycerophosphate synthase
MLQPLARRRVHPNWVTAVSYVATLAAIPFFASASWVPGLALAYLMSVLDSVDGKLARLTYTNSRLGNVLDHGLDLVHPPLWYLAWGLGLGGGDPGSGPFAASLWLLGVYVLDRICAPVFKYRTGRSIHGYTPLDARLRTFISRRNVNLVFFTAALVADAVVPGRRIPEFTFYAIVVWQAVSLAWHAERVVHFWNARAGR